MVYTIHMQADDKCAVVVVIGVWPEHGHTAGHCGGGGGPLATGHDNTLKYVITDTSTLCLVCAD